MSDQNNTKLPSWMVPAGEYRAKAIAYVLSEPLNPSEDAALTASIEFQIVEEGQHKGSKVTWRSNLPGKDNLGMAALNRGLQALGVQTAPKQVDLNDPPISYDKEVIIVVEHSKSKDGTKTYCNVKWINDPDRPRGGKTLSERVKPIDPKSREAKAKVAQLAALLQNVAKSSPEEEAPPTTSRSGSKSSIPDDDIPF